MHLPARALHQRRIVVGSAIDLFGYLMVRNVGPFCGLYQREQTCCIGVRVQPFPVHIGRQDDGHPVMYGSDKLVRRAGDEGAGIDVPAVRSFSRPDAGKCYRRMVLAVEPYRRLVAGVVLLPLVEAACGYQAAASLNGCLNDGSLCTVSARVLNSGRLLPLERGWRAPVIPQRSSLALFAPDAPACRLW